MSYASPTIKSRSRLVSIVSSVDGIDGGEEDEAGAAGALDQRRPRQSAPAVASKERIRIVRWKDRKKLER
jgi:hypothetical protein